VAKASPIQQSFNAGELSKLLFARSDVAKYKNGLEVCYNAKPLIQGAWKNRSGTYYVAGVKTNAKSTRIVRFEFSTTQAYIIEFGDLYCRFYMDHGQIAVSGVAAYNGATNYVIGDLVSSAGVNYYCIAATVGNAPPNATYWYALTGTIYEIPTPYVEADLFELSFTQSADVLYIAHQSYAPRKLSRTAHTDWTLTTIDFLDGPYLPTNAGTTTFTLSGTTGSVTVTASAITGINNNTGFQTTDVGRLIRWKDPAGNWTWLQITARTNTTVVTATIRGPNASAATATINWRLGVWSDTTGYPGTVAFFEDRLFWGGSTDYPQRLDGSKSGDYENYAPTGTDGTVAADNAVAFTLNAGTVNVIRWMVDNEKGLLVGTVGGEWLVRPSTQSEALSPTNIKAAQSDSKGSKQIQAIKAGRATLFVQRAGRKLRELAYVFEVDGFRAPDLTPLAEHITRGGLGELVYQQEPHSVVWSVRGDGALVGLTYERDQDVLGWHWHEIAGSFGSGIAVVESIAGIPEPNGTYDELWLIVKRTINGATVRHIEYMKKDFEEEDDVEDAFFVDSGLTYSGAAATVITGLDHLEGQTVSILANGATHPTKVVSGGSITLDRSATKAHIGLGYVSDGKNMPWEAGAADGTAQGKIKRPHTCFFRLHNSMGLKYGSSFAKLDEVSFRTSTDDTASPVPLFTGDKLVDWPGDYDVYGQICWRQDKPLPLTVLAVGPQLHTQDR
jgi:hypothetical protein